MGFRALSRESGSSRAEGAMGSYELFGYNLPQNLIEVRKAPLLWGFRVFRVQGTGLKVYGLVLRTARPECFEGLGVFNRGVDPIVVPIWVVVKMMVPFWVP